MKGKINGFDLVKALSFKCLPTVCVQYEKGNVFFRMDPTRVVPENSGTKLV